MKIIFCHIAYLRYYDGRVAGELKPASGGRWVVKNEDAHEKWNFLNFDGCCYGFVQGNSDQMHIENLDKVYTQQDTAEDVTVIWCANHPERGTVIVGWYEHATCYRYLQPVHCTVITGIERSCCFKTAASNAYLLPEEFRTFPIGRASKDGAGKGFGQQNYWFAQSDYAKNELIPNVMKFMEEHRNNRINLQNTAFLPPEDLSPLSDKEEKTYIAYPEDEHNLEILSMAYRVYHNQKNADNAYAIASTLANLYQYRLSLPWYEETMKLDPEDRSTKGILAYTYQQCECYDLSDNIAKDLLATETSPDAIDELYCILADNAHLSRRTEESLHWLDTLLSTSSNDQLIKHTKKTKSFWEKELDI